VQSLTSSEISRHQHLSPLHGKPGKRARRDCAGDASALTLTPSNFRLLDLSRGLLILKAVDASMALSNVFSLCLRPKVPDAYSSHG
jgi:hypothetical protein